MKIRCEQDAPLRGTKGASSRAASPRTRSHRQYHGVAYGMQRSEERRVGSDWSSDVCSSDLDSLRTGRPFARYQRGVLSRSVTAHSFPSSISRGRLRNADLWRFGLAPKFLSRWLYIRTLPSRAHRLRYQDALLVRAANPRRLEPPLRATCSSAPGKLTHWSCSRCQPACRYAWWLA